MVLDLPRRHDDRQVAHFLLREMQDGVPASSPGDFSCVCQVAQVLEEPSRSDGAIPGYHTVQSVLEVAIRNLTLPNGGATDIASLAYEKIARL
jgi:hypothetical protein